MKVQGFASIRGLTGEEDEEYPSWMGYQETRGPSCDRASSPMEMTTSEAGKLGACGCLEKVLEAHREVSRRGNNEDIDDIGGGECHRMLQMSLSLGLYRTQEVFGDS